MSSVSHRRRFGPVVASMRFFNKVVLVTGASSGIGAATAELFAKEGAHVALVGRNATKLDAVAKRCQALGQTPLIIKADISVEAEAGTIIDKTVDRFGKLDILVNNAGIFKLDSVADPNVLRSFDEIMNTNLRSIVQLTNLAVPHLKASRGNVVNVSSIGALRVQGPRTMTSCVSKAALDHFTYSAALDLAASGVRVNSVNPGLVRTDILENSGFVPPGGADEMYERLASRTALGKVGDPEDLAELIAFLASDKAKTITGSIFVSDSGDMLMK